MGSALKTTAITAACAVALNLSGVGRALAVWCQADAPMTYQLTLATFIPWVTKLVGGTGSSLEDAITQAGAAQRGEILKATMANKAIAEGIAANEQKVQLQRSAVELRESLQAPANTCQSMATSATLSGADQAAQVSAFRAQLRVMSKVDIAANSNTMQALESSYKTSNEKFCTPEDRALGIACVVQASGPYKDLAGADQDAMFLFQTAGGSPSAQGGAQDEATDAYIKRVLAGAQPQALASRGEEFYKTNPQARAYVELSRRYNAMMSMPAYALAQIRELHKTEAGLGTRTMLASVPGYEANKADMSMSEAVERYVATKFSPGAVSDLAKANNPNLILRDMAQMNAFQLWMSYQAMQQSMRAEGIQAHQLALIAESTLRPQLDAQRAAAARSSMASR